MIRPAARTLLCLILVLFFNVAAFGQADRAAPRELEWESYKLPTTTFTRRVDSTKTLIYRTPTEWAERGSGNYTGPDGTVLRVLFETVPDGIPVSSVLASILQNLQNLPGGADSVVVRQTSLSGFDAREVVFETPDVRGVMMRRVIWTTVHGENAINFIFITPSSKAPETEPYFKAVMESVLILRDGYESVDLDKDKAEVIKQDKPEKIDGVLNAVAALDDKSPSVRAGVASRIGALLADSPAMSLDLVEDRRPVVRLALIEALAAANQSEYQGILVRALGDPDLQVAEAAARALAPNSDIVNVLRTNTLAWYQTEKLFRIWPFLDAKARVAIASEIFNPSTFKLMAKSMARETSQANSLPPPPPPSNADGKKRSSKKRSNAAKKEEPPSGIPIGSPTTFTGSGKEFRANQAFAALWLLKDIPAADFKTPISEIIAVGNDVLTVSALDVAYERWEVVPFNLLMKLLSSANVNVQKTAAVYLGQSAITAEIPQIERRFGQLSSTTGATATAKEKKDREFVIHLLKASVKEIRFRSQLANVQGDARLQAIREGLRDRDIANWVWTEYKRDGTRRSGESTGSNQAPGSTSGSSATQQGPTVAPYGENVFPQNIELYAAIPKPGPALAKIFDSLGNIQMETASDQATYVLFMNTMKAGLARALGARAGRPVTDYTGINFEQPMAAGRWTAEGAPNGLQAAQLKAAIVRVSDKERFERLLSIWGKRRGFGDLPELLSVGARFFGLLPAMMPTISETFLKFGFELNDKSPAYRYSFRKSDEIKGHPVTVIEVCSADSTGLISTHSIYILYLAGAGDYTALVAPDRASLTEALARIESPDHSLAGDPQFKQAVAGGGDVIYMSDLGSIFAPQAAGTESASKPGSTSSSGFSIRESGALRVSNSKWESSYRFAMGNPVWARLFQPFDPRSHSAADELLPRSTVMYLLLKTNISALWPVIAIGAPNALKGFSSGWAVDFQKEVIPELGPECGAALLGIPKIEKSSFDAPWIIFFKLKTDKLTTAFAEGRLVNGATAKNGVGHVKLGQTDAVVAVKNGFLVLAKDENVLHSLDQAEKLKSARDFSRSLQNAPASVVAFGGYNLEAGAAAIAQGTDFRSQAVSRLMKSLTSAFHSQNFYFTADAGGFDGQMSVSLDREGRYSVSELAHLSKNSPVMFADVTAGGFPILDQTRLDRLTLQIRLKSPDAMDRIKQDITSPYQKVDKTSDNELTVTILPRKKTPAQKVTLPVSGEKFAPYLGPTPSIQSQDNNVVERARQIAAGDTDAWSVARKLSKWVYTNLKWKNIDPGNASHTLAVREATCLQFSELYVAMARALGLPARIVDGMVYSDGSFGGHAWVEVYAGDWVELDPTFGTDFVDATHLREQGTDFVTYAALNLASINVVDAPRSVADYQRDPTALAERICKELSNGEGTALGDSIELPAIADELMGAGGWKSLSAEERGELTSAYRRLLTDVELTYRSIAQYSGVKARVLSVKNSGDQAEALIMGPFRFGEAPMRLVFKRIGSAWALMDMIQLDRDFHMVSEGFKPAIQAMKSRRNGKQEVASLFSPYTRLWVLADRDPKEGLDLAERQLKENADNRDVLYVKASCLAALKKQDEALKLFAQLSDATPPFAPAVRYLAEYYSIGKDKDAGKAVGLYQRYIALIPDDPRSYSSLARLYIGQGDLAKAEAQYRLAKDRDPKDSDSYADVAYVLALEHRYTEALALLDEGAKYGDGADEMFSSMLTRLSASDHDDVCEGLVAADPARMEKNYQANLYLGYARVNSGRAREALPLFERAAKLDQTKSSPHDGMAEARRKLHEWRKALADADLAIKLDSKDGDGYYERACALARLGRIKESLEALKKSIDLDDLNADLAGDEDDLKPLAGLPEFKKLVSGDEQKKPDGKDK